MNCYAKGRSIPLSLAPKLAGSCQTWQVIPSTSALAPISLKCRNFMMNSAERLSDTHSSRNWACCTPATHSPTHLLHLRIDFCLSPGLL